MGERKIKRRVKKKRIRLKPRFYLIVFLMLLAGATLFHVLTADHQSQMPSMLGWTTDEVLEFESRHPEISIIFDFDYSDQVLPARVMSQSIAPGTTIGPHPLVMQVEISKGTRVH